MSRSVMSRADRGRMARTQAGRVGILETAGGRRGDSAHDPTVSYRDASEELAARTGWPAFDFGRQADRAAMGHLLGRISRNRSWPAAASRQRGVWRT